MDNETYKTVTCITCGNKINEFEYYIYLMFIVKKNEINYLNMTQLREIVDEWLDRNPCHLSATELILTRADIIMDILKEWYPEMKYNGLVTCEICKECFEIYKKNNPLL